MALKRKLCLLMMAALLIAAGACAAENNEQPELWFPVGEQLTYQIYWGIFPVAESRVTTE